jgi:hypothetical protein
MFFLVILWAQYALAIFNQFRWIVMAPKGSKPSTLVAQAEILAAPKQKRRLARRQANDQAERAMWLVNLDLTILSDTIKVDQCKSLNSRNQMFQTCYLFVLYALYPREVQLQVHIANIPKKQWASTLWAPTLATSTMLNRACCS